MKEIELKYRLDGPAVGKKILEDSFVGNLVVSGTEEDLEMEAVYYDTPDRRLSKRKVAYRVRKENDEYVATVKWSSCGKGGLSVRNECNIEVGSEIPDLTVFRSDIDDSEILELLDDSILEPILITRYLRRKAALEYENTVAEIAVDVGEIVVGEKTAPICELELELISGNVETLVSLGEILEKRFELEPEEKSKIRRGMELIG